MFEIRNFLYLLRSRHLKFFLFIFIFLQGLGNSRADYFPLRKAVTIKERSYDWDSPFWISQGVPGRSAIKNLISLLERSQVGSSLVRLARNRAASWGLHLEEVVIPGRVSLTDTTILRHFSSQEDVSEPNYEMRAKIYINEELTLKEALLDLAHELSHFTEGGRFNPYLRFVGPQEYIINTIEGRGGEAQAVERECQVLKEIFEFSHFQKSNCYAFWEEGIIFNRKKIVQEFYRMGPYVKDFQRLIGLLGRKDHFFPKLSSAPIKHLSGHHGLPYPLAAIKDYKRTYTLACENELKRVGNKGHRLKNHTWIENCRPHFISRQ